MARKLDKIELTNKIKYSVLEIDKLMCAICGTVILYEYATRHHTLRNIVLLKTLNTKYKLLNTIVRIYKSL